MPALFDGMAGLSAGVFGDPITYIHRFGAISRVQSIFRETPVEAQDQDGRPVYLVSPTWRVSRVLVPDVARGDQIIAPNGQKFEVKNVWPSGSPAVDATVVCELKKVDPA